MFAELNPTKIPHGHVTGHTGYLEFFEDYASRAQVASADPEWWLSLARTAETIALELAEKYAAQREEVGQ